MGIQRIALLVLIIPLPLITLAQRPQVARTVVLPTPTAADLAFPEMPVAKLFNNGTWQISKTDVADLEIALPQVAGLKAVGCLPPSISIVPKNTSDSTWLSSREAGNLYTLMLSAMSASPQVGVTALWSSLTVRPAIGRRSSTQPSAGFLTS
jgi:hypothetical protein